MKEQRWDYLKKEIREIKLQKGESLRWKNISSMEKVFISSFM